jgi:hypothetical protein
MSFLKTGEEPEHFQAKFIRTKIPEANRDFFIPRGTALYNL